MMRPLHVWGDKDSAHLSAMSGTLMLAWLRIELAFRTTSKTRTVITGAPSASTARISMTMRLCTVTVLRPGGRSGFR